MKRIVLSVFVLILTYTAAYAEMIDFGGGYYFDTPKREGNTIIYNYKMTNIENVNKEILEYNSSINEVGKETVSYIQGSVVCDCTTYKVKSQNIFYGFDGKPVASHKDAEFVTKSDDMVKELCSKY